MPNYYALPIYRNPDAPSGMRVIVGGAIFDLDRGAGAGEQFVSLVSHFDPRDLDFSGSITPWERVLSAAIPGNYAETRFTFLAFNQLRIETADPFFDSARLSVLRPFVSELAAWGFERAYGIPPPNARNLIEFFGDQLIENIVESSPFGYVGQFFLREGLEYLFDEIFLDQFLPESRSEAQFSIVYASTGDVLAELRAQDRFIPYEGPVNATIISNNGNISGTPFDDNFSTSGNGNTLHAGEGNDSVTVNGGSTSIYGGSGIDLITIDFSRSTVAITGSIDNVGGSDGNFSVYGSASGALSAAAQAFERFIIFTGSGDDNIATGDGDDRIETGDGNDILDGGAGADVLIAGNDNDTLISHLGADTLDGGEGVDFVDLDRSYLTNAVAYNADLVRLSNGFELVDGTRLIGIETVRLRSGSGDDNIVTSLEYAANEEIYTGAGNDTVLVGGGSDTIVGGSGIDLITIDFSRSTVAITGSIDNVGGSDGNFSVYGSASGALSAAAQAFERFIIFTGSGDDNIATGDGDDRIETGDGNDILDGGAGADQMIGGGGDDVYIVDSLSDVVNEQAGDGSDTIFTIISGYALPDNVETIVYIGTGPANIRDNNGDNRISLGNAGGILNFAQGGIDSGTGGSGNDGFYFGAAFDANDQVNGGAGTLDQVALQGDYSAGVTLGANSAVGIEQYVLLPGSNSRFGLSGNPTLAYNIITGDAAIAAGQRLVFQANTLRAGESFTLDAGGELDGSVFTYGGLGTENLRGSQNGDAFFFGTGRFNASDVVNGEGGSDQLGLQGTYSGANAVTFGAGQLLNLEMIVCLSNNDSRFGGAGSGTPYSYTLTMNDGNVAAGSTLIIQANALASDEVLTFNGAAELDGHYTIYSGDGADGIIAGALADTISGRGGADNLTGGGGNDSFLYTNLTDSIAAAQDRVLDFASGDVIDLSRLDAVAGEEANDAFTFIGAGAFSNTAGQLRAVNTSGNDWLVEADVNGDGIADLSILVTTSDADPLTAADFAL